MKIHRLRQICRQWGLLQCAGQGEFQATLEIEDQERQSVLSMVACWRSYPIRLCYSQRYNSHGITEKKDSGGKQRAKRTEQRGR